MPGLDAEPEPLSTAGEEGARDVAAGAAEKGGSAPGAGPCLEERCRRAVERCVALEEGDERAWRAARDLGAAALASGAGLTDVVPLLWRATAPLLPSDALGRAAVLRRIEGLMRECLVVFEQHHRGATEVNEVLRQSEERLEAQARRIARELHDEAGQLLATVHVALEAVRPYLAPGAAPRLDQVTDLLLEVEDEIRRVAHELRPVLLDDLGLLPALEFLGEGVARRAGMRVTVAGSTHGRLPGEIETAIYRAAQEALSNAARHARATWVVVRVRRSRRLVECRVHDDGCGFEPSGALARWGRHGIGLEGLRDRIERHGGTVTFASEPGQGTEIVMRIPLGEPACPLES